MQRYLIVNADDGNLTEGVNRAIWDAHDHGIVTSSTLFVNFPVSEKSVRAWLCRKKLGLGIHLNVTLGFPLSSPRSVKSLLDASGCFRKKKEMLERLPKLSEIIFEYENQIARFKEGFGRLPTHLDTHHQMHDHPLFFKAVSCVAGRHYLPVRRSRLMMRNRGQGGYDSKNERLSCPDFMFGNLDPGYYWRSGALENILRHLPEGSNEIMCHPGLADRDLRAVSSFTTGREKEWRLLRDPSLRRLTDDLGIRLVNYGECFEHKR